MNKDNLADLDYEAIQEMLEVNIFFIIREKKLNQQRCIIII
jgi:hypothetical protein